MFWRSYRRTSNSFFDSDPLYDSCDKRRGLFRLPSDVYFPKPLSPPPIPIRCFLSRPASLTPSFLSLPSVELHLPALRIGWCSRRGRRTRPSAAQPPPSTRRSGTPAAAAETDFKSALFDHGRGISDFRPER